MFGLPRAYVRLQLGLQLGWLGVISTLYVTGVMPV